MNYLVILLQSLERTTSTILIMARNKYPTQFKEIIVKEFKNGDTITSIAKKYSISHTVISRIVSRARTAGSVETIHRGGRPRKTSNYEDRRIVSLLKKDPFLSARTIKERLDLNLSARSVQRRAVDSGLHSFRIAKKPFISAKNRKARLKFARDHLNWTIEKWKTVLFSDESKFNLKSSDGFKRVRRPIGERLNPRYLQGTVKHGGGNIMVWGCFSGQGIGPIHKINGIMDRFVYKEILQTVMLPYAEEEMTLKWKFQQDNDPKHTAKVVKEWFNINQIDVMEWPAQSPDLNPIENLWEIADRRVKRDNSSNTDSLFAQVEKAWKNIPIKFINNLIESMPRRCAAVIKNNGYSTKY